MGFLAHSYPGLWLTTAGSYRRPQGSLDLLVSFNPPSPPTLKAPTRWLVVVGCVILLVLLTPEELLTALSTSDGLDAHRLHPHEAGYDDPRVSRVATGDFNYKLTGDYRDDLVMRTAAVWPLSDQ